jgi:hypothetical protein
MAVTFDGLTRRLLDGKNFATVATLNPDGGPHSAVVGGDPRYAELVEDPNKALPLELSHRYLGVDPPAESDKETRLIVRVIPEKVTTFSGVRR